MINAPYHRKSSTARLGYILLLFAAGFICYPIGKDIYEQLTTEDPLPVSSANALPNFHKSDRTPKPVTKSDSPADHVVQKPLASAADSPILSGSTSTPVETEDAFKVESTPTERPITSTTAVLINQPTRVDIPSLSDVVQDLPAATPTISSGQPVVQQTQRHPAMITPGNFIYLGAFRLPELHGEGNSPEHYGQGITFRPTQTDKASPGKRSGSLFIVGRGPHDLVAECDIPDPVVSGEKNIDELPVASLLQPFSDITGPLPEQANDESNQHVRIGGLEYQEGHLHWTRRPNDNSSKDNHMTVGVSSAKLEMPSANGLWHWEPQRGQHSASHSNMHAGFMMQIPMEIANQYFNGRSLVSGLQFDPGQSDSSHGPGLLAYRPPTSSNPAGGQLDAIPLLSYSPDNPIRRHHYADQWAAAAWVTVGARNALIIVGRKAHGPAYLGDARPGDCYRHRGYHGSVYETQMLFYAPAHLLQAAHQKDADVQPWMRWSSETEGGGIDRFMFQECRRDIGGLAYDRENNLLYLSELQTGFSLRHQSGNSAVIHVFQLTDDS